jgi:hypothetical protein
MQSVHAPGLPETVEILGDREIIIPSSKLTARLALLATVLYDGQGLAPSRLQLNVVLDEHGHRLEMRLGYE